MGSVSDQITEILIDRGGVGGLPLDRELPESETNILLQEKGECSGLMPHSLGINLSVELMKRQMQLYKF